MDGGFAGVFVDSQRALGWLRWLCMAGSPISFSMANHWNSWFNFQSGKQSSNWSTLLEANVAAQSAGMHSCVPYEADGQSIDEQSISGGSSMLSAASTTSGGRTSFADQQQQPLEQMCTAHFFYHLPFLDHPPAWFS